MSGSHTAVALGRVLVHDELHEMYSQIKPFGFSLGIRPMYVDDTIIVESDTASAQISLRVIVRARKTSWSLDRKHGNRKMLVPQAAMSVPVDVVSSHVDATRIVTGGTDVPIPGLQRETL